MAARDPIRAKTPRAVINFSMSLVARFPPLVIHRRSGTSSLARHSPVSSLILSTLIVVASESRTESHDDTILVFYPINNKKPFRVVLTLDQLESLIRRSLRATLVPRSSARSSHSRSAEQTARFSLLIESSRRISK